MTEARKQIDITKSILRTWKKGTIIKAEELSNNPLMIPNWRYYFGALSEMVESGEVLKVGVQIGRGKKEVVCAYCLLGND